VQVRRQKMTSPLEMKIYNDYLSIKKSQRKKLKYVTMMSS